MKIKEVKANYRKKAFEVTTSKGVLYHFPYSKCEVIPTAKNRVSEVFPDKEIGQLGFEYLLEDGKSDSILLDTVLDYNADPEYLKKARLYNLTTQALDILDKKGLTKNEIRRRMGCTKTHLNRLLDTSFYGKSTDEMIRLLRALDCEVDVVVREAS